MDAPAVGPGTKLKPGGAVEHLGKASRENVVDMFVVVAVEDRAGPCAGVVGGLIASNTGLS